MQFEHKTYKLKYNLYSLQKDKEAQLSQVKLSEVERIHLFATLLKEKKSQNHHHKQDNNKSK